MFPGGNYELPVLLYWDLIISLQMAMVQALVKAMVKAMVMVQEKMLQLPQATELLVVS